MTSTTPRPLHKIADEITKHGGGKIMAARPYINAMRYLATMDDSYGHEDAEGIVLRFLSDTAGWRGEDAKRLKAELRSMLPRRSAR